MNKFVNLTCITLTAGLFSVTALAGQPAKKGNGLPRVDMSDSWSLVIHARPYDKCPTSGFDGTNRRSLVVAALPNWDGSTNPHGKNEPDLSNYNDIELVSNDSLDDFYVIDGNACDDDSALVSLPIAVASTYDVYIKLLGKPDEATAAVLCADLVLDNNSINDDDFYCNTGTVRVRKNGGDHYVNVTDELLFLTSIDCLDGQNVRDVPLFDACLEDEFWDWSATEKAKSRLVFVPK